jgi:hypothetical protein
VDAEVLRRREPAATELIEGEWPYHEAVWIRERVREAPARLVVTAGGLRTLAGR